jgi:hypothetical protein
MTASNAPRTRRIASNARTTVIMIAIVLAPWAVDTQVLDICGCGTIPNLQPFDSRDPATHPPGTVVSGTTVTLPVPPDGILRFSSFFAQNHIRFATGETNAPVTILVSGDVTLSSATGCCWSFDASGQNGTTGSTNAAGIGGRGGVGAFRGGDGASRLIYGLAIAGAGFGAGGGKGGEPGAAQCGGRGGQFFGAPDLLPLAGGAGGGGGCSVSDSCSAGGGGGGGGGAFLIAANGTLTIRDYSLLADGGGGGGPDNGSCASGGGGGSGGAIRLLASKFVQIGTVSLVARGAGGGHQAEPGSAGRIRLESLDASALSAFSTDPPAQRIVGPTPLANPVSPTVTITGVGGLAPPAVPQGTFGSIDVVVPVSGITPIDVATSGIPGGTTVQVTVKPRRGAHPFSENVPLASCNGAGHCQATATFNLPAGSYVVEARATLQTQ